LLKEKGMEENTLFVFTSDNGPHKEKGGDPEFFNGSGGLRGIKRDLYEGGIREPFLAYQKGKTKPGYVSHMPAALWDLFPTFLQAAGVKNKPSTDGISILPTLKGERQDGHPFLYWEFHEGGGKQAVRMGDWKGVRLDVNKDANGQIELYNLKTDPGEKQNVATKHPAVVKKIAAFMQRAYVPNKDWPLLPSEFAETNQ